MVPVVVGDGIGRVRVLPVDEGCASVIDAGCAAHARLYNATPASFLSGLLLIYSGSLLASSQRGQLVARRRPSAMSRCIQQLSLHT